MKQTNSITCPNCSKALKRERGIRMGQKIKCGNCAVAFSIRPEDMEKAGGVNGARLGIVLAGALIYLLCGAGMATYCFTHNAAADKTAQNKDSSDDESFAPPPVPPPPRPGAVSAAEQRKIDDAITKGVWFLRGRLSVKGDWERVFGGNGAIAALPGLALLECGVPADDPIIQKIATAVRTKSPALPQQFDTYQRSLAILFLDRLGASEDEQLIRYLALCLMAGQDPTAGAWTYACPALDRAKVPEMLQMLADDKQALPDWRKTVLNGVNFNQSGQWDNSNTQFAILALWVAQRHQVPIDKSIALVEKHFRTTQLSGQGGATLGDPDGHNVNLDGSWHYDTVRNASIWPSMTCSGFLGVAIAHGVSKDVAVQKQKPLDDPAIQRGLAMFAREIGRPNEGRAPDLYYLWSLERVGVLYDLPIIDGKDWYAWGREILLSRQITNGAWKDGGYYGNNPVLNTSFALLFLKQANLAKDLTDKLQLLSAQ